MDTGPCLRVVNGARRFVATVFVVVAVASPSSCQRSPESVEAPAPVVRSPQDAVDRLASYVDRRGIDVPVDLTEVPDGPDSLGGDGTAGEGSTGSSDLLDTSLGPRPKLPEPERAPATESPEPPRGRWVSLARPATVRLPESAARPFAIADDATRVSLDVRLVGARDVAGADASGHRVFSGAYEGGELIFRVFEEGVEDYVFIETAPKKAEVRYEVGLGASVAGLRLVGNTLEFLDDGGAPRLRVNPPWLVDADGERINASLAVIGCAVDTDPRGPWGRPVIDPGARICTVAVSWERDAVTYPAVLDPVWSTTGTMSRVRSEHQMVRLNDGRVLVMGGRSPTTSTDGAELLDLFSRTWSATSSMVTARYGHTAALLLTSGKVLVAGGSSSTSVTASAELYEPTTGQWSPAGQLSTARYNHQMVVLNDGRVLVAGGRTSSDATVSAAELYHPGTNTWSSASTGPGCFHLTATRLQDGRVLAVCGSTSGSFASNTARIYVPELGEGYWMSAQSAPSRRELRMSGILLDGRPFIAGGRESTVYSSALHFYSVDENQWVEGPSLPGNWAAGIAVRFDDGRHFFASGSASQYLGVSGTAILSADGSAITHSASLPSIRAFAAMVALPNARALLTGGNSGGSATSTAWLFHEQSTSCTDAGDCDSGFCVDGVCCDGACDAGGCDSCNLLGFEGICMAVPAGQSGSPSCSPYLCSGTSGACPTACVADDACAPNHFCDDAGHCVPYRAQGSACGRDGECGAGHCEDGVCCNRECGGACQACSQAEGAEVDGTCLDFPEGHAGEPTCAPYLCGNDGSCASSCSTDDDCTSTHFCNASGTCEAKRTDGSTCSQANQCSSGNCADGRCCNEPCDGPCNACSAARGSVDGVCEVVGGPGSPSCSPYACDGENVECPTGCTDHSDCATNFRCVDGACRKLSPGEACTVSAHCSTNACVDGVCCSTSCSGGCGACSVATGSTADGTCTVLTGTPGKSESCAPYVCRTSTTCPATCSTDDHCIDTHFCSGSTCQPRRGLGSTCTAANQCGSGFCVDGRCCDGACDGACDRCNNTSGQCSLVTGAGSPTCFPFACTGTSADCPTTCATDAHCATNHLCRDGECVLRSLGEACTVGAQCASGNCVDGVCCNNACTGACNACSVAAGAPEDGTCSIVTGHPGNPSCSPYLCGSVSSCPTTCANDSHCVDTHYCSGGTCRQKSAQGAVCSTSNQCQSGFCVDGRCCESACSDSCDQCNASGRCVPVTGGGSPSCEPYVCSGTSSSCPLSCTLNSHCSSGYFCHQNECIPKFENGTPCTSAAQCGSNRCVDGVCCNATCSGACQACSIAAGGSTDGTCTNYAAGHPGSPVCANGFVCTGLSSCPTSCSSNAGCAADHYCEDSTCKPLRPQGTACESGGQCLSGICSGGVCCDRACDGSCETCRLGGGAEADGKCTVLPARAPGSPACPDGLVCTGLYGWCPDTCTSDSLCADQHFCDDGACVPERGLGEACDSENQCASGNCVDGVCCNSECAGSCEFCSVEAGGSVDGQCSVGAGKPGTPSCHPYLCRAGFGGCPWTCTVDAQCAANHWCDGGSCVEKTPQGGVCMVSAQCATGHCVDGRCCDSPCSGACNACSQELGSTQDGVCEIVTGPGSPSCWPYLCRGESESCPTSCTSDAQCHPLNYCEGGACVPRRAQGSLCSTDSQCQTGHCVDGRCCESACDGPCEACSTATGSAANGWCLPVVGLAPPVCAPYVCDGFDGDCPVSCTSSAQCAPTHFCDGGVCQAQRELGESCSAGLHCKSGHCVDGVCCNKACSDSCDACSAVLGALADGLCSNVTGEGTPSCAPFACNGTGPWCPSVCNSNDECAEGFHCSGFQCVPNKETGAVCTTDHECALGHCVDGRCCGSACTGACERCDVEGLEGTCSTAPTGTEPRVACTGGLQCSGDSPGCPGSCLVDGSAVAGDAVCPENSWCGSDGTCRPKKSISQSCERAGECALGHCIDGVCCDTECGQSCASCSVSGSVGLCTAVPSGHPGEPACKDNLVCNGISAVCPSFCVIGDDSSCAPGHFCVNGLCATDKADGEKCTRDGQCLSGFCVDGVCCDSACDGACDACDLPGQVGQCTTRPEGAPGVPACADGWTCDGAGSECPAACVSDASCAFGYHCHGGACRADLPLGASCDEARECALGHCVDGVCCNRECTGSCEACSTQAGGSADGTCSFVVGEGTPSCSPFACNGAGAECPTACTADIDCASDRYCDAGACVPRRSIGEICDEGRVCSTGACVDGRCCNVACDRGCEVCSVASGAETDGICAVASGRVTYACAPYVCDGSAADCATTCDDDSDCADEHWCDDGACVPAVELGDGCDRDRQCDSGHCADGVCCDSACLGACEACALDSGASGDGTCTITALAPGRPSCAPYVCVENAAECPDSCTSDLDCDAESWCSDGACVPQFPAGTLCDDGRMCLSGSCVDGVCCDRACDGPCEVCSAAVGASADGLCTPITGEGSPSCAPYVCGGDGSGCLQSCTTQADCAPGWFCGDDGRCSAARALGEACEMDAHCGSGHCVDGVCCDTMCAEQCAACNLPDSLGLCRAVSGPPAGGREPCASDDGPCGGLCDGVDPFQCSYPDGTTACGEATCDEGVLWLPGACDGAGACEQEPVDCGPFACDAGACVETCSGDGDCADGHFCREDTCVFLQDPGAACRTDGECASGTCAGGFCCEGACAGGCMGCGTPGREGECLPLPSDADAPACGPYRCDGARSDCPTSCASNDDCSEGNHCVVENDVGRCRPQGEQGARCSGDDECRTGICADGFCCDRDCSGQCTSCGLQGSEGTCSRVTGAAAPNRTSCSGWGVCAGVCDGTSDDCAYPDPITECGPAWCADGVLTGASVCDGKGFCRDGDASTCEYGCAGDRCRPAPQPRGGTCSATGGADLTAFAFLIALGVVRLRRRGSASRR